VLFALIIYHNGINMSTTVFQENGNGYFISLLTRSRLFITRCNYQGADQVFPFYTAPGRH